MSIGERIKQRRQELGLSVDEIARQLGKNRATIYRYEGDEIENLPLNILEPLAKVLRVSPAYIMGWDTDMPDYQVRYVPLLVAIEDGRLVLGEEKVHYHAGGANAVEVDFCLRIDDANMVDTRIQHGDLVFIKQQPMVDDGEVAAVVVDSQIVLGRLYSADGGIILEPLNKDIRPRLCGSDIQVLGRAVLVQSRL